jgi:hypothetical protein
MLLSRLPPALENADALIARRGKALEKKELWRSTYTEAFQFAMPTRETFTWRAEGQNKQSVLYDSTLMEATYTAANTTTALLFPSWMRWAELTPGGAIKQEAVTPQITDGLQKATAMLFSFLNSSNFGTVIGECALDLMVGTCSLSLDEGDNDKPFAFSSIPLSAIEIEEGPNGTVETTWMCRKVPVKHLPRMYPGLEVFDLSESAQKLLQEKPETEIEVIQGEVFHPGDGHYYGVVIEMAAKHIVWRYDYQTSSPTIVARATKVSGETYGRGRVLLALPDAKTLDKMVEFTLRHAALQVAPPMTGVSDGVLNPYTASLTPATIIPVASNDDGSPSLRPLDIGGNFNLTEALLDQKRQAVRRIMLGPEPSEGAVKSATEIDVSDRNRLWAMNGEFSRIQAELLAKIIARCVFILQKKGLMPRFRVDGREVAVKYTSPFAKTQNAEDVMALQEALMIANALGPQVVQIAIKIEDVPAWVFRMKGLPEVLIRGDDEKKVLVDKAQTVLQNAQQADQQTAAAQGTAPPEVQM